MMRLLLILLALLPYPYTVSLSRSEAQRGQTVVATISAPANAVVALSAPPGIISSAVVYAGGETWRATVQIASDAPESRTPVELVLVVDGVPRASAPIRIWTDAPQPPYRVALPLVMR